MIRRSPTQIPMSDLDVQDIRDMVEAEKEIQKREAELADQMKALADNPNMTDADNQMLENIRKIKEERERRLGIQPETSGQ
ncbi:hypothetical protein K435DRAFT_963156 [Dendrothele bispora CBS 962.96]|uniref:Uncharacterized protein n=1 Tax=Dendrothele bispora (strain CBS 962.96) TaxID=1314807 RepID=A0A4S8MI82_DENBC|nr:hypothetical protein K435DRAFT_963156 [Dendrothele bispora CBS 962.96]